MKFFNIIKRKNREVVVNIYSPIDGKIISLSDVPDEVYAQKMIGDGCAIEPTGDTIYCPLDSEICIEGMNHVVDIVVNIEGTSYELEIFFHFGIARNSYTNGRIQQYNLTKEIENSIGMVRLTEDGVHKKGDKLIKLDYKKMERHFYSMKSPFIITSMDIVKEIEIISKEEVKAGDLLMRVILK